MNRDYTSLPRENPFQRDRLREKQRPIVDLPVWSLSFTDECWHTASLMVMLLIVCWATVLFGQAGAESAVTIVLFLTVLLAIGPTLLVNRLASILLTTSLFVSLAFYNQLAFYWHVQLGLAWIVGGVFGWSYSVHYLYRCSVTPMELESAEQLRRDGVKQMRKYTVVAIGLPLVALAAAWFCQTTGAAIIALAFVALVYTSVLLIAFLCAPIRFTVASGEALLSWLNYNALDDDVPGIFLSPSGSRKWRVLFLGITLVCFVLPLGSLSSLAAAITAAKQMGVIEEVPEGDFNRLGTETLSEAGAEVQPELFVLTTSLGAGLFLAPVLLTFATSLFIFSPVLVQAYSARIEAETSPNKFYAILRRMRQSPVRAERESVFWAVNAFDGSPVIIHHSLLESPFACLGDPGSGKSALQARLIEHFVISCVDHFDHQEARQEQST